MKLFPAIDIMNKKAVRLKKGVRSECDVYGDPVEKAYQFLEAGAKYLHIVDLNAAFDGVSPNRDVIAEIAKIKGLTAEIGGGNRTLKRVEILLEKLNVARVIIGSAAVTDRAFTEECARRYGDRVVLGLDALNGKLKIKGWVQETRVTPKVCALSYKDYGVTDVVYTDISRDGLLTGVNVEATAKLQKETGMNLIASGGVKSLEDIEKLQKKGVYGVILGRSLYEGTLDLKEALKLC